MSELLNELGFPRTDVAMRDYFNFFAANIAMDPARYGVSDADSASISLAAGNYSSAYDVYINPATRDEQALIQKDQTRNAAAALIRLYCMQIKYNAGVSTEDKAILRISEPNPTRTRRDVPPIQPEITIIGALVGSQTLGFKDPETGNKAKPFGAQMLELRVNVAEEAGGDPETARPCGVYSKNPIGVPFPQADNKKIATYWGRWANTRGQVGPWSLPVSMTIAA